MRRTYPVEMHVFHISSIVLVPWSSCLGGYSSVPDDYPLVLGCEEHDISIKVTLKHKSKAIYF